MPTPNLSFTLKSKGGLLRSLKTDINIHPSGKSEYFLVKAIWDTGATNSVITEKVVQKLGLIETGFADIITANGEGRFKTYTLDIGLPNKVLIKGIKASATPALTSGCEALIGMDIINLGDFSITNHKGITCMSFRIPSSHEIDYVKHSDNGIIPIKNIPPGNKGSNFTPPKKKRRK